MVFGISFECDFTVAVSAFEVKSKDFDAEIGLLVTYLHTHIELGADVEIVGAGVAT